MIAKQGSAKAPQVRWIAVWGAVLTVAILAFVWNLYVILRDTGRDAAYREMLGNLRVLSQQIDAAAREAVGGDVQALDTLATARAEFATTFAELDRGGERLPPLRDLLPEELAEIGAAWSEVDTAASGIVTRRDSIRFLGELSTTVDGSIEAVQKHAARVAELIGVSGGSTQQVALAEQQQWLTERIARNLEKVLQGENAVEAAARLGPDVEDFADRLGVLQRGSTTRGVPALPAGDARDEAAEVQRVFRTIGDARQRILDAAPDLEQARAAADAIARKSPRLLNATGTTSDRISALEDRRSLNMGSALLFGSLITISLIMIGILWSLDTRRRLVQTAATNERNQHAILRLLDEIAGLADGDLTSSATVTEDFTGAIADAINYTIDQLRVLVSSINRTSHSVSQAAEDTQATALHLAEAAEHQAQEIAGASSAVNEMAFSIDQVSSNAAESASVADRSVALANTGSRVVQNTIGGMDTIREQIQETAKRIKRLGESSQEIGDIVSLINDIADQTNILALNAAIQASMAGEAGRGFAVVADEVQRLAERSSGATRQIEALVKTIQSDTHEAVMSMEQTTSEVVRGARLAEDAGVALEEIETVSKSLAALIQNISNAARQQASSAGHISNTMNIIQEITSQTAAGTTAAAQSVGKLASMTNELRGSVAGFKLPESGHSLRSR